MTMKAYLCMQELWEICISIAMSIEPQGTVEQQDTQHVHVPPSAEAMANYQTEYAAWKIIVNDKAGGAILLRLVLDVNNLICMECLVIVCIHLYYSQYIRPVAKE